MKKIFVLSLICFSMTTVGAYANGHPQYAMPTVNANSLVSPSKDFSDGGKSILQNFYPSQPDIHSQSDLVNMYADQKVKEREYLYSALHFSSEQRLKAETLDADSKIGIANHVRAAKCELQKLRLLKVRKASKIKLWAQQRKLLAATKSLNNYVADSQRTFEKIMTKEQKERFEMIQASKDNTIAPSTQQNGSAPHNLYKKNPVQKFNSPTHVNNFYR